MEPVRVQPQAAQVQRWHGRLWRYVFACWVFRGVPPRLGCPQRLMNQVLCNATLPHSSYTCRSTHCSTRRPSGRWAGRRAATPARRAPTTAGAARLVSVPSQPTSSFVAKQQPLQFGNAFWRLQNLRERGCRMPHDCLCAKERAPS